MANFKRQVGAVNSMGKAHAKGGRLDTVKKRNLERLDKLVQKLKERSND